MIHCRWPPRSILYNVAVAACLFVSGGSPFANAGHLYTVAPPFPSFTTTLPMATRPFTPLLAPLCRHHLILIHHCIAVACPPLYSGGLLPRPLGCLALHPFPALAHLIYVRSPVPYSAADVAAPFIFPFSNKIGIPHSPWLLDPPSIPSPCIPHPFPIVRPIQRCYPRCRRPIHMPLLKQNRKRKVSRGMGKIEKNKQFYLPLPVSSALAASTTHPLSHATLSTLGAALTLHKHNWRREAS